MSFSEEAYIGPVLTEEVIQLSFLLRTPSAFQQASRSAFALYILGRAAILGYEKDNYF
jgi:hypothetical protein